MLLASSGDHCSCVGCGAERWELERSGMDAAWSGRLRRKEDGKKRPVPSGTFASRSKMPCVCEALPSPSWRSMFVSRGERSLTRD
jgi:hypothetical protein